MKTNSFINTLVGPIAVTGAATMLRDEVLGKLVHENILISMESVGVLPVALSAIPKEDGSLLVFYSVHLSADELEHLPSIYDAPPAPIKKRKRNRRK